MTVAASGGALENLRGVRQESHETFTVPEVLLLDCSLESIDANPPTATRSQSFAALRALRPQPIEGWAKQQDVAPALSVTGLRKQHTSIPLRPTRTKSDRTLRRSEVWDNGAGRNGSTMPAKRSPISSMWSGSFEGCSCQRPRAGWIFEEEVKRVRGRRELACPNIC